LTRLLGRDELLGQLVERTADGRLITLTGIGGSGKTRLALAVADRASAAPRFVDLSAVECGDVVSAVGAALGVRDDPAQDPLDAIAAQLGADQALLVLDNCEHLVDGCADLVRELLARCPKLAVLATSRRPLGVPGEVAMPVPPLATDPAIELFLERASARSGHPAPPGSAPAVAELCAELDGLPLAIELAAARTAVLTVEEILSRVRADLRTLRSPAPNTPQRHRTLAAVVASSVAQLSAPEERLLRRLAAFAGTFDREAVQAIWPGDGEPPLAALVGASLVDEVQRAPSTRYRLLRTIQRSVQDIGDGGDGAGGDEAAARRAHAAYYLRLAERAEPHYFTADQEEWVARLAADWLNLSAAMTWFSTHDAEPHGDLRLAAALATYCHLRGHYRDGRAWLDAALVRNPGAPAGLRARAGAGAAMLAMLLCDYPAAAGYAERAQRDFREAGDRRGQARVEMTLGSVARERGEYARSAAHLDAAAAGYAECGDERGEARATQLRGFTAWLAGDLDRAEPRLRASLHRFERLGDPEAAAAALVHLAAVAHYRGDQERAGELVEAGLRRYAELGFPEGVAWAHNLRGLVELARGRAGAAEEYLRESLAVHRRVGDRWRTASVLCALAEVARRSGAVHRAARLLGAAAAIRQAIGVPVPGCERAEVEATTEAVRAELGDPRYQAESRAGRTASLDALAAASGTLACT
jgi:predicted ATPase